MYRKKKRNPSLFKAPPGRESTFIKQDTDPRFFSISISYLIIKTSYLYQTRRTVISALNPNPHDRGKKVHQTECEDAVWCDVVWCWWGGDMYVLCRKLVHGSSALLPPPPKQNEKKKSLSQFYCTNMYNADRYTF